MTRSRPISVPHAALIWFLVSLMAQPSPNLLAQQLLPAPQALVIPPASVASPLAATAPADTNLLLQLARTPITLTNGQQMLALSFFSDSNHNYVVEFRQDLGPDLCNNWQPLASAPHNYGITFTTNSFTNCFYRLRRIDVPRSPLFALLANDTGTNSLDGLTSDPTITGLALAFPPGTELRAALDHADGPFITVTNLGTPRYFLLPREQLAALNGGPLPDGPHTLSLRAVNGLTILGSFDLPFTLDTTPPAVTVRLAPGDDSAPVGDGRTTFNPVTLFGQTEPGARVELLPNGLAISPDTNGAFVLTNVVLAQGTNQFYFRALDAACNETNAETRLCWFGPDCAFPDNLDGWIVNVGQASSLSPNPVPGSVRVAADKSCAAVMTEGDSFLVALSRHLTIPTVPATLNVTYQITFDGTTASAMRDAFEVALVDAAGRPLTFTIQGSAGVSPASVDTPVTLPPSPDAVFNHSDGRTPFVAPGAALAEISNSRFQIAVDVSHLAPGSSARLILRLVNNDRDRATTARISEVVFKPLNATLNFNGSSGTAFSLIGAGTAGPGGLATTNPFCPPGASAARLAGLSASTATFPANFFGGALIGPETTNGDSVLPPNGRLTFTTTAEFERGTLFNLSASVVLHELQLVGQPNTFPFIWIANSGEGTLSKFDTRTGREVGRYRTGPEASATRLSPSRTTVDLDGNCWVGNRGTGGPGGDLSLAPGTAVKVLQAGFVDRNGNGRMDTSEDLNGNSRIDSNEMLPWDANGDGLPDDERIALVVTVGRSRSAPFTPQNFSIPRSMAVDAQGRIWVGLFQLKQYELYDPATGQLLAIVPTTGRPYGAVVDRNGFLWGSSRDPYLLERIDSRTLAASNTIPLAGAYGITLDPDGVVWATTYDQNSLFRYDPATGQQNFYGSPNGESQLRGVGVDVQRNVWVASTSHNRLIKYSFAADHRTLAGRTVVNVGNGPTAAVVDSDGFVWTTCLNSDNAYKVDPTNNTVVAGWPVPTGDYPYNYSDMTGAVLIESTRRGTWTEIVDSGRSGTVWGAVDLTSTTPPGTLVGLKVRASDARGTLPSLPEIEVIPGQSLPNIFGRYLEVKVTLGTDVTNTTPTVRDITVVAVPPPALTTDAPGSVFAPGATILISGQAIAAQPSLPGGTIVRNAITYVTLNGASVDALDAAGNYYRAVQILPGLNTFIATATDLYGQTTTNTLTIQGACPDNASNLQVVSASVQAEYGRTSFNEWTRVLYADLAVRNAGTYPVRAPFYVGVTRISDPTVRLLSPDGVSADGIPYYDFSAALAGGSLNLGSVSAARALAFLNPNRTQFTYDLVILGQLNQPPYFTTTPDLEAIVNRPYAYDSEAVDPDGDTLTYSLTRAPAFLTLNPANGLLSGTPGTNALGTHDITLLASDGHGGTTEQHYLLSVIAPPSNRPPYFVSTPIAEARLGASYTYDADAIDPDGDTVTYSLQAPTVIPISIINAGFETPSLSDDQSMANIPGWSVTGNAGVWNPASTRYNTNIPERLNVGYCNGGTVSQVLPATLMPDTRYVLEVDVGARNDVPFPSFAVSLRAGGVLLAKSSAPNPLAGFFTTVRVAYQSSISEPLAGQNLEILVESPGVQVTFDNVRLTAFAFGPPDGLGIDAHSGIIRWGPTAEQIGTHNVTVLVQDGRGGSNSQSYLICVLPAEGNRPPIFTTYPGQIGLPHKFACQSTP